MRCLRGRRSARWRRRRPKSSACRSTAFSSLPISPPASPASAGAAATRPMPTPRSPASRRAMTSARSTGGASMPPAHRTKPSPARGRRWSSEDGQRRGTEIGSRPHGRHDLRRGKDTLGTMAVDRRKIAVATAGFCTFLTLYSPQALLPALAREFGVGAAEISAIMTASTLAIALTAPFIGPVADVLGRKRVIAAAMLAVVVPLTGAALAPDVQALVVAYIGDEWPAARVAGVAGIYI